MKLFSDERGFMILESMVLSLSLLSLAGIAYFLQADADNYRNCKAEIIAGHEADMYLDEIAVLHNQINNKSFSSNGIEFTVDEAHHNDIVRVEVEWSINGKKHSVVRERRYRE